MKFLLLVSLAAVASLVIEGAPLDEEFGYVDVRPGAHMFWVMYHVDQEDDYTNYPLIMWLQGGPGISGVGFGNFEQLGPKDLNGNSRKYAWTKSANLMFVDNPVGTGYSYVDSSKDFAIDNMQIAADLVALVKEVFTKNPDMQKMPFFVFAESYGGKMTVDFALALDEAIKNGKVVSDFRGVALGNSWISPMDSINTWGTYLYQMGWVNREGLNKVDAAAAKTQTAVDEERWTDATNEWSASEGVVSSVAHDVNLYNVLAKEDIYLMKPQHSHKRHDLSFMSPAVRKLYERHVGRLHQKLGDSLFDFMNGAQKEHWVIPDRVEWEGQGGYVFVQLREDFMKPVVDSVVRLLAETDLMVNVYTGDLDLMCDTPGTYRWIENMKWEDKVNFMAADTKAIHITEYSSPAALLQSSKKFALYTILRAGHMVPMDVPEMGLKLVDLIVGTPTHTPEAPKQETTKQETPKQEAPKQEAPKQEAPKQEAPKQEAPKQEAPKKEAPKKEAPKKEASKKITPRKHVPVPLSAVDHNANRRRAQVVATDLNPATPTGKRYVKMIPNNPGFRRG